MKKWIVTVALFLSAHVIFSQDYQLKNSTISVKSSFRALNVVNDKVAWVGGSKGMIGRTLDGGKSWSFRQIPTYEALDFRSIYAFDSLTCVVANAGSPAYIFRTTDGGKNWIVMYKNEIKEAFIDGVDFWNDKKGIAYGDPINGRMLLLSTLDGGLTWKELPESLRPQLLPGEASFAASGTGLRCYDKKKIMITTGGKISRLWTSKDDGETWTVSDLPVIQGEESTGAFSAIFWKEKYGVVVGGDFKNDAQPGKHIFITLNKAKEWTLPIRPTRGLRECVEYLGNDNLIAIGPQGADVSNDRGVNWYPLSDEKGFHVLRKARDGSLILAAGNGKIAVITKK
jgi:photosystem II stability/assembly factor-like uncharacterized protein